MVRMVRSLADRTFQLRFYAQQSGKNAEAMKKFQDGAKRKFKNFVGDLMDEKKKSDAGAAKTKASQQRLDNFRKE